MAPALYLESRNAMRDDGADRMPNATAMTAQISGEFTVEVETDHGSFHGGCLEVKTSTDTLELFPAQEVITLHLTGGDETTVGIDMSPRAALELAKKLMAMSASYDEDIGACDPCGELFPMEELHKVDSSHGEATACTRCVESGSV